LSPRLLYLLDTNTVSHILSGRSTVARQKMIHAQVSRSVAISVITEAEIRYGVAKKPEATRRNSLAEEFLDAIGILPWDSAAAAAYGTLRAAMEKKGKQLASMDMLIAAQAVAHQAILGQGIPSDCRPHD